LHITQTAYVNCTTTTREITVLSLQSKGGAQQKRLIKHQETCISTEQYENRQIKIHFTLSGATFNKLDTAVHKSCIEPIFGTVILHCNKS